MERAKRAANIPALYKDILPSSERIAEWNERKLWRFPLFVITGKEADKYASVFMLWRMSFVWSGIGWQRGCFVDTFTAGVDADTDLFEVECLTLSAIEGVTPQATSWISGLIRARRNSPHKTQTILTTQDTSAFKRLTDDVQQSLRGVMVIRT